MFIKGIHTIACTPSETVKDLLEINGISRNQFATQMGMSEEEANTFLDDYVEMTDTLAAKLHTILGPASTFWKNLEKGFLEDKQKIETETI